MENYDSLWYHFHFFPIFSFTQLFLVYSTSFVRLRNFFFSFSFPQLFSFVYATFFLLTCFSIRSVVQFYAALQTTALDSNFLSKLP